MQRAIGCGDALYGGDTMTVGLDGKHQAGTDGRAVEENGAGAADPMFAANMGAGEFQMFAQEIRQIEPWLHMRLISYAVDVNADGDALRHVLAFRPVEWPAAACVQSAHPPNAACSPTAHKDRPPL